MQRKRKRRIVTPGGGESDTASAYLLDLFCSPNLKLGLCVQRKRKRRIVTPGGGESDTASVCSLDLGKENQFFLVGGREGYCYI